MDITKKVKIKNKYKAVVQEMGRARCMHWVDRWPRAVHTVIASTKKELETKKKKIEKNIKILNSTNDTYKIYLEDWKLIKGNK